MLTVTAAFLVLALLLATVLYAGQRGIALERAARADGSFARQFVWVDDDGAARELNAEELAQLNAESPVDAATPPIQQHYVAGSTGFLLRSKLPQGVTVRG